MSETHQFTDRTLIDEVAALRLQAPEDVVINHSAVLAIHGIIRPDEVSDIDAAVSWENSKELRQRIGWEVVRKTAAYRADGLPVEILVTQDTSQRYDFHRWDFSMLRYKDTGHGRVYLPELKETSTQDSETGIWVASLEYVAETMQETGRSKDAMRLKLIQRAGHSVQS